MDLKKINTGNFGTNGDTLYLNSKVTKQKQENVRDCESLQILDVSPINDMGNAIRGTECMNLLIKNWETVASSSDQFRNFGVNDVDTAISGIMKSINNVDELNADNIGLTNDASTKYIKTSGGDECIDDLIKWIEHERPYDDKGKYGGNQRDYGSGTDVGATIWFEDDEIYNFVRRYPEYKDASQGKIHDMLERIKKTGCTYMGMANMIFDQYVYNPEEFKSVFGFDMIKDGDLNYAELCVDIFVNTENKFYLDEPFGIACYSKYKMKYYVLNQDEYKAKYNEGSFFYNDKTGHIEGDSNVTGNCMFEGVQEWKRGVNEIKADYQMTADQNTINRFSHYCREHGIDMEYRMVDKNSPASVQYYLNAGYSGFIGGQNYDLQTPDGKIDPQTTSHLMTVTGTTNDGKYKVSSWGEMWYLDPKSKRSDMILNNVYLVKLKKSETYGSLKEKIKNEMINLPGMQQDRSCMNIFKKYPGYANVSYDDACKVLDSFEKNGTYAKAAAEAIIDIYKYKKEEFKEKFHLDINRKDVVDLLALDIYLQTDGKVYLDEPGSKDCCAQYIYQYYCKDPKSFKRTHNDNIFDANGNINNGMDNQLWSICQKEAGIYEELANKSQEKEILFPKLCDEWGENATTFQNRIDHYFKENNIEASVNMLDYKPTFNQVDQMLKNGSRVSFWTDRAVFALCDIYGDLYSPSARDADLKEFVITSTTLTRDESGKVVGRYVVSCGGKQFIFDPRYAETTMSGFCEIKNK